MELQTARVGQVAVLSNTSVDNTVSNQVSALKWSSDKQAVAND